MKIEDLLAKLRADYPQVTWECEAVGYGEVVLKCSFFVTQSLRDGTGRFFRPEEVRGVKVLNQDYLAYMFAHNLLSEVVHGLMWNVAEAILTRAAPYTGPLYAPVGGSAP